MPIRVPRKPTDAYQHGNLREALVQAGLRLLAEGGVENLSLRAAAQLAGVSHAAPYRHFRDKEALVAAIARRGFELLTEAMRRELQSCAETASIRQRLTALGRGYLRFALANPGYLKVIFGGVVDKKAMPAELHAAGAESFGVLRGVVAEGVACGELAGDPDTLALACWSLVHGLAMLAIEKVTDPFLGALSVEAFMTKALDVLHEGIQARGRRR